MVRKNITTEFLEIVNNCMWGVSGEERTVIAREFLKILELSTMLNYVGGGSEREYFAGKAVTDHFDGVGQAAEYFSEIIDDSAKFIGSYVRARIHKALKSSVEDYESNITDLVTSAENYWRDTMRCIFIDSDYGNFFYADMPGLIGDALANVICKGSGDLLESSKIKIAAVVNKYINKDRRRVNDLQKIFACDMNKAKDKSDA